MKKKILILLLGLFIDSALKAQCSCNFENAVGIGRMRESGNTFPYPYTYKKLQTFNSVRNPSFINHQLIEYDCTEIRVGSYHWCHGSCTRESIFTRFYVTFKGFCTTSFWEMLGMREGEINGFASELFAVFPNPLVEGTTLNLLLASKVAEVKILDPFGNLVYQAINLVEGKIEINTSELNSGLYMIQVLAKDGEKVEVQKLIVQ